MKEKKEKKQNGYFRHMAEAIKMELREHKSSFMVYLILRILVIVMLVLQVLNQNYENVFLCILTLLLLIVPSFLQVTFKIELPTTLEIIVLFFIFAAEILGEINEFYLLFPFWDTVLHTLNGFLAAAIGFSLVDLLNRSERTVFHLSPVFTAIVAFCFSMTIGVVWEFFEFGMDQILGFDMQKDTVLFAITSVMLNPDGRNVPVTIDQIREVLINGQPLGVGGYLDIGLIDTMEDLFVNFISDFVKRELAVTLNTDNPAISSTTIANEFAYAQSLGITLAQEEKMLLTAVDAAFTDKATKDKLKQLLCKSNSIESI